MFHQLLHPVANSPVLSFLVALIPIAVVLLLGVVPPTVLMAATDSSGGVLGKMISPQNIATGAAMTGMQGR